VPATVFDVAVFAPGAFICGLLTGWVLASFFKIKRVRDDDDDP
jgi:hypothetical protein